MKRRIGLMTGSGTKIIVESMALALQGKSVTTIPGAVFLAICDDFNKEKSLTLLTPEIKAKLIKALESC